MVARSVSGGGAKRVSYGGHVVRLTRRLGMDYDNWVVLTVPDWHGVFARRMGI